MKDRITCFKLNWHNWGLCCGDNVVQEEVIIYRKKNLMVFKELNGYGVVCSCEIIYIEKDKAEQLFDFLEQHCEDWESDYMVEVDDGSAWTVRMWYSSHKVKKIRGTAYYPPHGKKIDQFIRSFIEENQSIIAPKLFGYCEDINALMDSDFYMASSSRLSK